MRSRAPWLLALGKMPSKGPREGSEDDMKQLVHSSGRSLIIRKDGAVFQQSTALFQPPSLTEQSGLSCGAKKVHVEDSARAPRLQPTIKDLLESSSVKFRTSATERLLSALHGLELSTGNAYLQPELPACTSPGPAREVRATLGPRQAFPSLAPQGKAELHPKRVCK